MVIMQANRRIHANFFFIGSTGSQAAVLYALLVQRDTHGTCLTCGWRKVVGGVRWCRENKQLQVIP